MIFFFCIQFCKEDRTKTIALILLPRKWRGIGMYSLEFARCRRWAVVEVVRSTALRRWNSQLSGLQADRANGP